MIAICNAWLLCAGRQILRSNKICLEFFAPLFVSRQKVENKLLVKNHKNKDVGGDANISNSNIILPRYIWQNFNKSPKMKAENIKYFLSLIQKENDGQHIDYIVPGYAGKKIVGYQSMREDLILCTKAAGRFPDFAEDEVMSLSILHTITILYGKCFTESKASFPKFDPNDCFKGESENLREFHNELMELRHNLSAHRGITEFDIGFPYLTLNIHDLSRQVRVRQMKRRRPSVERIENYLILFEYLIQAVEDKFKDAAEKLWAHMLKEYPAEHLALLKIAGPNAECLDKNGG